MTETAKLDINQVKFHLKLFNKYSTLNDTKGAALNFSNDDINKATLCKTFKVHSSDLQFRSGVKRSMMKLEKLKKQTDAGKVVMNIERSFMNMNIENANNIQEVDDMMDNKYKHRNDIRNFYYSNVRIKQKRRTEIQQKKRFDRTCSSERQFTLSKENKQPIMLTGDRGYCHNSSIKGHLKYGSVWKPRLHSLYMSVAVTNENLTSQTCVFCFKKTTHPFKVSKTKNGTLVKKVRGTAVCSNKHCILALKHETHKGRDPVSATAICISGSAMLLLKMQHPSFCHNDYNSETNTDDFRKIAEVFLNRNTPRPAIDDGITREI
ncbi:hypothetical protein EDC94DRAFT_556671 [Helicostylum pulchrum]|nr:hypothetical protein EDC94DRAFT_556671 [Helicostylum pulchrum]